MIILGLRCGMFMNRDVILPALLICLVSIGFIMYSFSPVTIHIVENEIREDKFEDLFENFGNVAILCGMISYSWIIFKKKLKSPSKAVKKWVGKLFALHPYVGGTSLSLAVLHGAFYFTDIDDEDYFTGIASILLLVTVVIYGWLIKRIRNPYIRKTHFVMSSLWVIAILIHAGDFMMLMIVSIGFIWLIITWYEKRQVKKAEAGGRSND